MNMNTSTMDKTTSADKSSSWRIFNRISSQYDFLNHVLSFGLDIRWRGRLIGLFPQKTGLNAIDLATGTADVLLSLCRTRGADVKKAYGIDLAQQMLEIGKQKIAKAGLGDKIELQHGDACHIPFGDDRFDAASIAFGIRNVLEPQKPLSEMHRVLKQGGKGLVLEFSMPKNPLIRFFHLFYLRHVVPFLGGILAGDYKAYQYLNQTIENFPYGNEFKTMMAGTGFEDIQSTELLFGTATIYTGLKP